MFKLRGIVGAVLACCVAATGAGLGRAAPPPPPDRPREAPPAEGRGA